VAARHTLANPVALLNVNGRCECCEGPGVLVYFRFERSPSLAIPPKGRVMGNNFMDGSGRWYKLERPAILFGRPHVTTNSK
jgi:hypothetical protein